MKDKENNATSIKAIEDGFLIMNMSVWENMELLKNYGYNSLHVEIVKRKKEWFEKMDQMHMALWYIEKGKSPTPMEAKEKLEYFREFGESPLAFSFKSKFTINELNKN